MHPQPKQSPIEKTWTERIASYEKGTAIVESLITAIRSQCSNGATWLEDVVTYRSDKPIKWSIAQAQTAKGIDWLRSKAVQKRLDDHDREVSILYDWLRQEVK